MLSADADRHGQPERENGWRDGPYLNSAFGNAKLSGQSFSGRYPRVGVLLKERLQGVLLAQLQNEPPPSRSSGDGGLWKRRKGKVSEDVGVGEDSAEVPKHPPRPVQVPLCLSKAGSPGTPLHLEVTWLHPENQAESQG